jgi:beta-lactamase regulating signal transducer with metallopeptidase domain
MPTHSRGHGTHRGKRKGTPVDLLLQIGLSNALMAAGLALAAFGLGRWCRRPAVRHALWLLVLLKLVTPPLVHVPLPWPETAPPTPTESAPDVQPIAAAPEPVAEVPPVLLAVEQPQLPDGPEENEDNPIPAETPAPLPPPVPAAVPAPPPIPPAVPEAEGPPRWPGVLVLAWLVASAMWLTAALVRLRRFHRLLAHARPAPAALQAEADALALRLGLKQAPAVGLLPGVLSPMLWCVGRAARLLIPADLLGRLSDKQRAALLVHELAHLRRRDHWVRWLELLVLSLYWWLPVAWWARRELQEAEEECCDAWVVWALPGSARAYAAALVETLDFLAEARPALPVAASGLGHLSLLRRRLTMIMRGDTPRALTRAGLLGVLALGVLLLPLVPTLAQSDRPRPEPRPGNQRPAERGPDLDKLRQDLNRMAADLQATEAHLKALQAELQLKARRLQQAQERLREVEKERADRPGKEAGPANPYGTGYPRVHGRPGMSGTNPGGAPRPDLDRRLAEIERKLDLILKEMKQPRGRGGPRAGQPHFQAPLPPPGAVPPGFQPPGGQPPAGASPVPGQYGSSWGTPPVTPPPSTPVPPPAGGYQPGRPPAGIPGQPGTPLPPPGGASPRVPGQPAATSPERQPPAQR